MTPEKKMINLFEEFRIRLGISGKCGLIGLRRALQQILHFVNNMSIYEELVVSWPDAKRRSAYQYLKRYGFIDYINFQTEEVNALGIRNPQFWRLEDC